MDQLQVSVVGSLATQGTVGAVPVVVELSFGQP
jgi:hypothetical protein